MRCRTCSRILPTEAFTPSRRERSRIQCRECCRSASLANYFRKMEVINAIKMERGCADCGYREHPVALEFDHLDGFTKVDNVSRMAGSASLERIMAEIAKCEVVCGNCHAIRTAERGAASRWWAAYREGRQQLLMVEDGQLLFDLDEDIA